MDRDSEEFLWNLYSIIVVGSIIWKMYSNGLFHKIYYWFSELSFRKMYKMYKRFRRCLKSFSGYFWHYLFIIAILGLGIFVIYSGGWLGVIVILLVLLIFK